MNLSQIVKGAFRALNRNSPVILTAIGVAGVVSTTVLAVRATPAAHQRIFEMSNEGSFEEPVILSKWDIIKGTWHFYIPAAGSGLLTIASIIGAQSINARRQAILISGVTVAERALSEYQDKVLELEPKLDEKVRTEIAKDRIRKNPLGPNEMIPENGDQICYDMYSGRYFHSTMEKIRQAKNDLNEAMLNGDMYASLNDFYVALGLSPTTGGEQVGWSTENMVDLNFRPLLMEGGRTCLAMEFRARPLQDYYKFR